MTLWYSPWHKTMQITIICDRCGKVVTGVVSPDGLMTAAYYDLSGCWASFARWEEEKICDGCMFADPKYKKIYNLK